MDFFKSLVLDVDEENSDENPHDEENASEDEENASDDEENDSEDEENVSEDDEATESSNSWSFGGLIETITTRSESVLETYRRDLQEFGTGLKKETEIFREAATKAVKDLPASIDAIDGVIKSTAEMISHVAASDEFGGDLEAVEVEKSRREFSDSVRYSRFEAQLKGLQNDVRTFRDEVEDLEEFGKWKMGFALIDRGEEIASLIGDNAVLEGVYKGMVPSEVDNETFWFRYFYRVHKLQQQESVRANLVKRAISIDEEEELSWDVDDDEDEEEKDGNVGERSGVKVEGDELVNKKDLSDRELDSIGKEDDRKHDSLSAGNVGEDKSNVESTSNENDVELKLSDDSKTKIEEKLMKLEENYEVKKENSDVKRDGKLEKAEERKSMKGKGDEGGLVKETDVSEKAKAEEGDLEWDEIEDVDSNDEKKTASSVKKPDQADLLKSMSTAEDDEDLSWDIEDDD